MSEKEDQSLKNGVLWEGLYNSRMLIPKDLNKEEVLLWACNEALIDLRHYHNRSDYLLWRADQILNKSIIRWHEIKSN